MKENKVTKKEKVQTIIIAILALIIVFMGAYFSSELKYCTVDNKVVELEKISMDDFTTLLNNDSASIIYLARPGCSFCQKQEPIVKQIVSSSDLPFYYLNTDDLGYDDMEKIFKLDEDETLFGKDGEQFGTPTTLIVTSGKIVDALIGYTEKTEYEQFLVKNGFDL